MTRNKSAIIIMALSLWAPLLPGAAHSATFERDVLPFLKTYCYDCHGDGVAKGGIMFDKHDSQARLMKDFDLWERVSAQLSFENMPPQNKTQPTAPGRKMLLDWIQSDVFKVDCSKPDPGRVTIRRLNRTEYNNTIRDLLGVSLRPADDFPPDDSGYGFDNIGDALSISPLHLEKYLAAAEMALDAAMDAPVVKPEVRRYHGDEMSGGRNHRNGRILVSSGVIEISRDFPADGEYKIVFGAWGHQAGNEPARMGARFDGNQRRVFDVKARENAPGRYEMTVKTTKGRHTVGGSFLNDYYNRARKQDRNLIVDYISVEGPLNPPRPPASGAHRSIFFREHNGNGDEPAAREIIGAFATRAFRRPATDAEVERLLGLWRLGVANREPFEASVKIALQGALTSPAFLFRGELQPEPDNPKRMAPINEHALAARLSYFIWSSMPDEELTHLAARRRLRSQMAQQVYRMLRSTKALGMAEGFASQWLQIRNLDLAEPSEEHFPGFDDELKKAMRTETEMLFKRVVREDRSVLEFLNADYTHLNERLARHYGVKGVSGRDFRLVSLKNTPRRGVLSHASVLTITSNPTRTSPVKRGLWTLENILGTPPPAPPPDVPELEEDKVVTGATLRKRLEAHRDNPVCSSCHRRMDPLGFGLENFNGVGQWRDADEGAPIDAAGSLVTGERFRGPVEMADMLAREKKDEFLRTLASRMLTFALGRGPEPYDKCAVDQIVREMERNDYKFSSLVLGIVKSVPFQLRRGEGER